jgi:hypothetical protein
MHLMKLELFMTTTYLKFMHNAQNQESTTSFGKFSQRFYIGAWTRVEELYRLYEGDE